MATMVETTQTPLPWWKEPTRDQWRAWVAAWLGWTLDSFDFTIFLLIMLPIAQEFNVPLTDVTFVFTITLWMRLVGAVSSGWLGDRIGRQLPLMISILGYSLCNSSRFSVSSEAKKVAPVTLPPGRLRLVTRPATTGSATTAKTIGMVAVAAFAASTAGVPLIAPITATLRRTSSAAIAGSRLYWASAQRYSITTFSPSTYPAS
jgi:MFS family permease